MRRVTWIDTSKVPPTPKLGHTEKYDYDTQDWKQLRRVTYDDDDPFINPMTQARHHISLCKVCASRFSDPQNYESFCLGERGAHRVYGLTEEEKETLDTEHQVRSKRWLDIKNNIC